MAAAGGLTAAAALPPARADAASTFSVTANDPTYSHTLSWPATSNPNGIKPQGNVLTHAGQLVTGTSHAFTINSNNSITHSHSFSNSKIAKSFSHTEPYLNGKAGRYTTSYGATITVTSPGHAYATLTLGGINYELKADTTGTYSATATLVSNHGLSLSQQYTVDVPAGAAAIIQPNIAFRFDPWTLSAVALGVGAGILAIADAPLTLVLIMAGAGVGFDLGGLIEF